MGGELLVADTLPVRFEIELPLHAPSGSLRDQARDSRTALVVEADPTQRWQLVQLVAQRGVRVVPAETPDDALDRFAQYPFDLVFCPWLNGRPDAMRLLENVLMADHPVRVFAIAEAEEVSVEATLMAGPWCCGSRCGMRSFFRCCPRPADDCWNRPGMRRILSKGTMEVKRLQILAAAYVMAAALLLGQTGKKAYDGPRPPKADVPYLMHARNLVETM